MIVRGVCCGSARNRVSRCAQLNRGERRAAPSESLAHLWDNRPHDLIRNVDQRSKDYSEIARTFRPGHADYTYLQKYGLRDPLARAPSKSLVVMDHGDLVGMLTGDGPPHAHAGSS
jgi:hypothetical protein